MYLSILTPPFFPSGDNFCPLVYTMYYWFYSSYCYSAFCFGDSDALYLPDSYSSNLALVKSKVFNMSCYY